MSAGDRRALVAIDLGAESCRVALLRFAPDGPRITLVRRFANAPLAIEGRLYWPFEQIEREVVAALAECAALAPEGVRSIAVDGWAVDYVRLADSGSAEDPPRCYRDERTIAAEAWVHARVSPETLRARTGVQLQRINTAYQLVADKLAGLPPRRWMNLPEYLLTRLGGEPVAEATNASHTQLMRIGSSAPDRAATRSFAWDTETFSALALPIECAPRIVPSGTIVGQLRGSLASLAPFRDTQLIAPACHDTASAIAGLAIGTDPTCAYISSGTWSLVGTVLTAPENGAAARSSNYTNLAAAGGGTLFHKGISGMWLLRQCQQHWEQAGAKHSAPALVEAASTLARPTSCLDVEAPELLLPGDMPGRINAHLQARGCAPLPGDASAAPLYANLIFHSLAVRYAEILREIAEITGRRFQRLHIAGGGSRNTLLNRMVAETSGLEVAVGSPESSILGNFAVQLAALEDGSAGVDAIQSQALRLRAAVVGENTAPAFMPAPGR